jgi:hypothetical protein
MAAAAPSAAHAKGVVGYGACLASRPCPAGSPRCDAGACPCRAWRRRRPSACPQLRWTRASPACSHAPHRCGCRTNHSEFRCVNWPWDTTIRINGQVAVYWDSGRQSGWSQPGSSHRCVLKLFRRVYPTATDQSSGEVGAVRHRWNAPRGASRWDARHCSFRRSGSLAPAGAEPDGVIEMHQEQPRVLRRARDRVHAKVVVSRWASRGAS